MPTLLRVYDTRISQLRHCVKVLIKMFCPSASHTHSRVNYILAYCYSHKYFLSLRCAGLRGAVAFALVLLINKEHVPLQPMFVTTTIAVIYFTVFLQGITIKPLVKFLNVERASKKKPTMNERIHERFIDHLMAGVEDIVGKTGNYNLRDKFKRFDNKFIRPLLIRDLKVGSANFISFPLCWTTSISAARSRAKNFGNLLEVDDERCHGLYATKSVDHWSNVGYGVDERTVPKLYGRPGRKVRYLIR